MSGRIHDIIRRSNLLSPEDLNKALEISKRDNISLPHYILKAGLVDERQLMKLISEGLGGIEIISPHELDIEPAIIHCLPREIVSRYRIIPINRAANNLIIAVADPTNIDLFDKLSAKLGVKLKIRLASEVSIDQALLRFYSASESERNNTRSGQGDAPEGYVINYIERLMQSAARRKASDIHIEPFETYIRVRLRVDGCLVEFEPPPRFERRDELISRVKIIAGLDISDRRNPQDGNAKIEIANYGKMDFRISCLPTVWGEAIVMRLLDKSNLQLDMSRLGFDPEQLERFKESIFKPFGMVIVTGPTGSGKTTTLYSALNELNRITDCVVTAEDPVEFTIPGIRQVNVKPDIGFTFAKALKAFLRQDPDVIMVGEVRDAETAEIAMKAALTGHMVLTTLHTNTAAETIERLRNLGIPPFTIISALNCVIAQRLVRKICPDCKKEHEVPPETQISLGLPSRYAGTFTIYKGAGCASCNGTGYRGRCAIYEVLVMNDDIRRAVADNKSALELKRIATNTGMQTMRQSAWKKVFKGVTSIDEMMDASASDT